MRLYTIGHSNVALEVFLSALTANRIQTLADIRAFPASRHSPQFNRDTLSDAVKSRGIGYVWFRELGGRRHSARQDSRHTGLRHTSFRNYADYMETQPFHDGIASLLALPGPTAYMCSEALYWRCHRRLVSDFLTYRGFEILHIAVATGKLVPHILTEPSCWDGKNVVYAAEME